MSHAAAFLAVSMALVAPSASGSTPFLTEEAPLQMLCRSFGFTVRTDYFSGRVSLRSGDHLLVVAPGIARAMIDGRSMPLLSPPRYLDGKLVVPAELADVIRTLGERPEAEAPGGRNPATPGRRPRVTFVRPETVLPSMLLIAGGSGETRESGGTDPASEAESPVARLGLIAIDPGHGGRDEGARGLNGTREKDIVLDIALLLSEEIRGRGGDVVLTRSEDVFVPLAERADIANSAEADVLISIHANGYFRRNVHGVETWIVHPRFEGAEGLSKRSREFAESLQAGLVEATGERDRGVREGAFMVLRRAAIPAALVEVGFLSHAETEARLNDDGYRKILAEVIADALFASGKLTDR